MGRPSGIMFCWTGCFCCCALPLAAKWYARAAFWSMVKGCECETVALVGGYCERDCIEGIAYVNQAMDQFSSVRLPRGRKPFSG